MLWVWGLGGAFLFAGPRWVRCWIGCRDTGALRLAFTPSLLTAVGAAHQNGISTLVGVVANPVIPEITKRAPRLGERILKALLGGEK
jgi:hypothetical protein